MPQIIRLLGTGINIMEAEKIAAFDSSIEASKDALKRCDDTHKLFQSLISSGKKIYGVNTGLGDLLDKDITTRDLKKYQENILLSHDAAIGDPLEQEYVRLALGMKIDSLLSSKSGVSSELISRLIKLFNSNLIPLIPSQGSLGEGDIAQMAVIGRALLGRESFVGYSMKEISQEVLHETMIAPYDFKPGESLALINGESFTISIAILETIKIARLWKHSLLLSAMIIEALSVNLDEFRNEIAEIRPHYGIKQVVYFLNELLNGSEKYQKNSHLRLQDATSIRCIPQTLGTFYDIIDFATKRLDIEMRSFTINPVVIGTEVISSGDFHGLPISITVETLSILLADIANLVERHIFRLLDSSLSGFKPFLTHEAGLESGYMISQYTASVLTSEIRLLANPVSTGNIDVSAGQEDHTSMAYLAALKLKRQREDFQKLLAIDYVVATRALELCSHKISKNLKNVVNNIRVIVPATEADHPIRPEIEKISQVILKPDFMEDVFEMFKL
ncbi:MAG: aromatic amino acid lyase [Candidatus Thermoplasmatota archaeon]|nr:aromatic amino acid lyase [Candidatus Thermoplasmatota archaeon]